jgi:hypothetical protein
VRLSLPSVGELARTRALHRAARLTRRPSGLALLFEDVVERLYRRDELMAGTLDVAGSRIGAPTLVSPMLNVINPRSAVIPPQSLVPFHAAAVSRSKALLHYDGDTGVALQHVGVLVGRKAHRTEGLILLLGPGFYHRRRTALERGANRC